MSYVELVKEYAQIARGEHPGWAGDPVANRDAYAFRIGQTNEDAAEIVRSVGISEHQYSLLTGLPPGSLRRFTADIRRGMRARVAS